MKETKEEKLIRQRQEIAEADAEAYFKAKDADREYWRHFTNKLLELRSELTE